MLEPIVGALYERLVTIVPEGPRCDRAFLEGEAVPPLVRQYLLSLLDREAEDRLTDIVRLDENWFDVGASSVQTALKSLRRAAVAAAGFPSTNWDNIKLPWYGIKGCSSSGRSHTGLELLFAGKSTGKDTKLVRPVPACNPDWLKIDHKI